MDAVKEADDVVGGLVAVQGDSRSVEQSLKEAEKYIELMGKIRLSAIRLTNNGDWSNQGSKPYLEKSGCDKIASAFGVKIFNVTFEKEAMKDDAGDYLVYTCSASGVWNNHEESEIGTCSTRDDFFGKHGGSFKPMSEVDITDVKKKAFTNLANRLIKKLIGLSFSWDEIKELSGGKITQETVVKVDRTAGARGGNTDSPVTKKKRDECRVMLLKLNDGEEAGARKMLVELTAFQGQNGPVAGKDHTGKLSEKQVEILHGKLVKAIESYEAAASGGAK